MRGGGCGGGGGGGASAPMRRASSSCCAPALPLARRWPGARRPSAGGVASGCGGCAHRAEAAAGARARRAAAGCAHCCSSLKLSARVGAGLDFWCLFVRFQTEWAGPAPPRHTLPIRGAGAPPRPQLRRPRACRRCHHRRPFPFFASPGLRRVRRPSRARLCRARRPCRVRLHLHTEAVCAPLQGILGLQNVMVTQRHLET